MESTMRPTYATTYLIFALLLFYANGSTAIFSSLAGLAKEAVSGLANAIGLTPTTLSEDPKIAFKQLPDMLKQHNLQKCEIDLDKTLKLERVQQIYDKVNKEINAKLPRRTEPLI